MFRYSHKSMSAILYAVAQCSVKQEMVDHDSCDRVASVVEMTGQRLFEPAINTIDWLELVKAELTVDDRINARAGASFDIELAVSDESRALKVARLIRNSYQLHQTPSCKVRLSIGVVLYATGANDKSKFLRIAESLALNDEVNTGNSIAFKDCSASD